MNRYVRALVMTVVLILATACQGAPRAAVPAAAPTAASKLASAGAASSGGQRRQLSMGAARVGGASNTLATGLAGVISKALPIEMSVKPIGDFSSYINLLENDEVQFGLDSMTSITWTYYGSGPVKEAHKSFQLLQLGTPQTWSIMVPDDQPVQTPEQLAAWLKGKRMTHQWFNPTIDHYNRLAFANLGINESDIRPVPISTYEDLSGAWSEGRTDTVGSTIGVAVSEQMYNARAFHFASLDGSPEAEQRMRAIDPSAYITRQEPGPRGVKEPIHALTYDYGFVASKKVDEQTAYDLMAGLYASQEELSKIHPLLANWGPAEKRWVNPKASIPYHPGAVRFFKEKGMWSAEMEAAQQALLAR